MSDGMSDGYRAAEEADASREQLGRLILFLLNKHSETITRKLDLEIREMWWIREVDSEERQAVQKREVDWAHNLFQSQISAWVRFLCKLVEHGLIYNKPLLSFLSSIWPFKNTLIATGRGRYDEEKKEGTYLYSDGMGEEKLMAFLMMSRQEKVVNPKDDFVAFAAFMNDKVITFYFA